ncbi:MAG: Hsp20/alpha crystallin family protein [Spirochaetales bacterium]|nr:Hsp20/alpha crystallin family protein [Spirochaetales bacterium]
MNLVKYNPVSKSIFGTDLDRFFDEVFDNKLWNTNGSHPRVDVREEKEQYILEADLPGLTDKDIAVKIENNLLSISSEKNEEKEAEKNGYLIRERKGYSFTRSFVLPEDVDREKINASFKNGVLTLTIAKSPEAQPKTIQVKSE